MDTTNLYADAIVKIDRRKKVKLNANLTISGDNYHKLLNTLLSRANEFDHFRRHLIRKLHYIDRELAGFMAPNPDDAGECDKAKKKADGIAGPLPQIKMHFADVELEDAIASALLMLVPQDNPYSATASKDKIKIANGFAALMNDHAKSYKHFSNYARIVTQAFSYNLFGGYVNWEKSYGKVPSVDQSSQGIEFKRDVIYEGNKIEAFDLYNTIWDMTLTADQVASQGEFIINFKRKRAMWIKERLGRNEIFGPAEFKTLVDDYIRDLSETDYTSTYGTAIESNCFFYPAPDFSFAPGTEEGSNKSPSTANEWESWYNDLPLSTFDSTRYRGTFEVSETYMWVIPKLFGLGSGELPELWYFMTIGKDYIVFAEPKNYAHGKLPIAMGDLSNRSSGFLDKSKAEKIIPINDVLSMMLNLDLELTRKALHGGITVYNPKVIKFDEANTSHSGRVKANMHEHDGDLRKHVLQLSDIPNTAATAQKVQLLMGLLKASMPTRSGKQAGDIDRAVTHQSQSAAYEANKQVFVIAKLIDERCFSDLRDAQYYNILENASTVELLDDKGETITVDPKEFVDAMLQFTLTDGLRGVDSLALQSELNSVINMAIQGRLGEQGVDLLGLINYYTSVVGDKTDLSQFRLEHPVDGLPTQVKDQLMQLMQQAQAESAPPKPPQG